MHVICRERCSTEQSISNDRASPHNKASEVSTEPLKSLEAREGILDAVGTEHIGNLAEEAVPVISNLAHVYTLAQTRATLAHV